MRILFDQGTPAPLRRALSAHRVETAYERGWSSFEKGELISPAEAAGFDVLVTTDRNLKYQQSLIDRSLSIAVLSSTSWPRIQRALSQVVAAVDAATPGGYQEVTVENAL